MPRAYDWRMFDVGESLRPGFEAAQRALREAQSALAQSGADSGARSGEAMAQTARAALFEEALLSAEHARLAELKAVAR
jgi:hypothetical protein